MKRPAVKSNILHCRVILTYHAQKSDVETFSSRKIVTWSKGVCIIDKLLAYCTYSKSLR